MKDFLTALGLAMVIEGVAYALFPASMRRMMSVVVAMPPAFLRLMGVAAAVTGVLSVWMTRSAMVAP